jgi:hypothetical protein
VGALSLERATTLVARIASVSVVICSLELLAERNLLSTNGLLNWEICRLRSSFFSEGAAADLLDSICRFPVIVYLLAVRLLAASILITSYQTSGLMYCFCLAIVLLSAIAISCRSGYGCDGADQMSTIIFSALFLASLFPNSIAHAVALWFISLQACLAYLTSGMAKLLSPAWRLGTALTTVMRTRTYGLHITHRLTVRSRTAACAVCWLVILTECCFPVVLLVPKSIAIVIFAGGILFHCTVAFVMGLNTFFWTFVATYPALFYCNLSAR